MMDFNLTQLTYVLICLIPGYVFEHVTRYKIPHQRSSGLEYFLNLLWHSAFINILTVLFFAFMLMLGPVYDFLQKHITNFLVGGIDVLHMSQYLCVYLIMAIILSYCSARIFAKYVTKSAKDKLPVFTRILNEIPIDKNVFMKITLKNKEIYSGQLLYYPNEYDILSSAKFHFYLAEVYKLENEEWSKIISDGLLVDSSEVSTVEFCASNNTQAE